MKLLWIPVVASLLFCLTTARAAGPLEVAPGIHTLEFENDYFQVLRMRLAPGQGSPDFFDVPEHVLVRLAPTHSRVTMADGTSVERKANLGSVSLMPAARIKPQSLSDKPYEFIGIMIKGKAAPRGGWAPGLETIAVDPGHHKLLAQTDKVTVMRAIWGPGESSPGFFYTFGATIVTFTATHF